MFNSCNEKELAYLKEVCARKTFTNEEIDLALKVIRDPQDRLEQSLKQPQGEEPPQNDEIPF
jgi:hypothetical protein